MRLLDLLESVDTIPDAIKSKLEIEGSNVILYHVGPSFSDIVGGKLSVSYFAKHTYTRRESITWNKPRIFFYTSLADKEWRVNGTIYRVPYPLHKLYGFNTDVLKLYSACFGDRRGVPVSQQLTCIADKAEERGFDGMISRWYDTLRADIWVDVPVTADMIINQ